MTMNKTDGLADLANKLAIKRSGWHRQENPETGAVVLFPETATYDAAWEAKALAQSQEAEHLGASTLLDAKPLENTLAARRITRGD